MKINIVTIGKPKLDYAKLGWEEYLGRLQRLHTVRTTQLSDKYEKDVSKINDSTSGTFTVALDILGKEQTSESLAILMNKWEIQSQEVSFIIGGPDGLPKAILEKVDYRLSLSQLTLPHDLAMVVTLETLYRASTINANLPYHR